MTVGRRRGGAPFLQKRLWRDLGLAVVGVAVGGVIAVVPGWLDDGDDGTVSLPLRDGESVAANLETAAPAPSEPVPGAESAVAAVEDFLAAEVANDLEASFALLSDQDRRDVPDPGAWVAVHADVLAPMTGYELLGTESAEGGVAVISAVEFEPSLDEVRGLVPGPATVSWLAVEDQAGWRVSLEGSSVQWRYPPDDGVVPAAAEWLSSGAACEPRSALPPGATFLGTRRDLLDDLCSAGDAVGAGVALQLEDSTVDDALIAAFGPQAGTWARAVTVDGDVPAALVLAPLGGRWEVVDVLRDRG